jgi:hypothetical protein
LKKIFQGDVERYIKRRRQRAEYIAQIKKDMNKEKYKDLKKLYYDREACKTRTNKYMNLLLKSTNKNNTMTVHKCYWIFI